MPGSGGVEPKGAIPEKGKNVGLSIMGYRFAPGSTFLHSHPRRRLQRVTANYVLTTADAHLPSACHCAPVRTLVRQSVSPQGNLASWLLFRQIRIHFPYLPWVPLSAMSNCKEYGLPRRSAPRNDRGRRHCAPRPRLPRQKRGTLQSYPGAHTPAKPVIANQCAHWCGNPFPCRETWQVGCCLGKFVYAFP